MAVGVSTYEGPVSFARAAPPPPVRRQGDDPSTPAAAGQYVPVASGATNPPFPTPGCSHKYLFISQNEGSTCPLQNDYNALNSTIEDACLNQV